MCSYSVSADTKTMLEKVLKDFKNYRYEVREET